MKKNPRHRSSPATLRRLADWHLFFDLDSARPCGLPPLAVLGQRVAALLAKQSRTGRAEALDAASQELARLTGLRSQRGFTASERLAWRRWAPFILALPGFARWSPADRRAAARVLRAKGGRHESDFAARLAAHPRLVRALFALC